MNVVIANMPNVPSVNANVYANMLNMNNCCSTVCGIVCFVNLLNHIWPEITTDPEITQN